MLNTASRAQPKGGQWKMAVISAVRQQGQQGDGSAAALAAGGELAAHVGGMEFYVTSGDGSREDRPGSGSTYRWAGGAGLAGPRVQYYGSNAPQPMLPWAGVSCRAEAPGGAVGHEERGLQPHCTLQLPGCSVRSPPDAQAAPPGRLQAAVGAGAALPQGHPAAHDAGQRPGRDHGGGRARRGRHDQPVLPGGRAGGRAGWQVQMGGLAGRQKRAWPWQTEGP